MRPANEHAAARREVNAGGKMEIERVRIVLPLALLLLVACQWSQPARSNVPPNAQPNTVRSSFEELKEGSETASPTPTPANKFTEADFARHVVQLRKKLPSAAFSIVIQPPFVVVGDEPLPDLQRHAKDTVKWAVDRLKQDFFPADPKHILDIWLFKDAASYEKHTRLVFNDKPTTPYGYYSSQHQALIMNIGTGGGTLVHEIVHPFMEANFPACPAWLNEGLGSLYEQCGDVNGHIRGFTNWRLPGLQQAIRTGQLRSFQTLMGMDAKAFYNDERGINYGQARYLCYYLQEQGLLIKFYQEFHARQKDDPSGYKSLQKVLAETDMEAFQRKWEKYVLGLN